MTRSNDLQNEGPDDAVLAEITKIQIGLNLEVDKEERYWEQKAHTNWLTYGNRNTTYFQSVATGRKKRNTITGLENRDGRWVEDQDGILHIVADYFKQLFTTSDEWDKSTIFF